MKPRLLFCSEASVLSTGYAVYAREILKELHKTGKYDIVELASYIRSNDSRLKSVPWKVVGNLPDNEEEKRKYDSNPINVFGAFRFDETVLKFRPHIVFDYKDEWFMTHTLSSPGRPYYHLIWMPTVDAYPQNKQWIDSFSRCDAIFTYNDWSKDVLTNQTGGKLKVYGTLPPGADNCIKPVADKIAHKAKFGLEKFKITGTVMRNQRRKLFPDLFESFRKFLDNTGYTNHIMYCHTAYPDKHPWNIPELLNEFNLASKVLFTYKCNNCGNIFPAFFSDFVTVCTKCNYLEASTSNVQKGCPNEFMNEIYNLFDVYVQYANSEGYGLPQAEAAAAGVHVMAVDYSAMTDVVRKLNGCPLKVKTLYKELESGCYRAVPDNDYLAEQLKKFFEYPDTIQLKLGNQCKNAYHANYGYDKSAKKLSEYIDSLNIQELEYKWVNQPQILNIPTKIPENLNNNQFVEWLIINVLGEPNQIGSYLYSRLLRDINFGYSMGGMGGFYLNENSFWFAESQPQEFNRQKAFEHFAFLRQLRNEWEHQRWNLVNKNG